MPEKETWEVGKTDANARLLTVLRRFRRDQDFTNISLLLMLRSLPFQVSVTLSQWHWNGGEVRGKREEVCKVASWSAQDYHRDVKRGKGFLDKEFDQQSKCHIL